MDLVARRAVAALRILAGCCLVTLLGMPMQALDRLPRFCLYRRLTGRPCPGCGLMHSVWCLLHLQFRAASHWNHLGFLVLPALLAMVISAGPSWTTGRRWLAALEIPRSQLRAAFRWVWIVLAIAIGLLLVSAAALPEDLVTRASPVCQRKARFGVECPLCGMTRDFLSISRGRLGQLRNRGSLPLYIGLVANEVVFLLSLTRGRRPRAGKPKGLPWESTASR